MDKDVQKERMVYIIGYVLEVAVVKVAGVKMAGVKMAGAASDRVCIQGSGTDLGYLSPRI